MPKIKYDTEEEEDFEEDSSDDFEEDLEEEEPQKKEETRGRKPKPKQVKRRFGIIAPQSIKIIDVETNELVGEGEYAVIQALTDILERLERIETKLGVI